jgi:hypothetical protein
LMEETDRPIGLFFCGCWVVVDRMQQLSDAVAGRSDAAIVGAIGRSPLPRSSRSTDAIGRDLPARSADAIGLTGSI